MSLRNSASTPGNITEFPGVAFHHRAIVAIIFIGLTPICLSGNALVIISVVIAKKLRTITNVLVVSLAFNDLATGLCLPFLSLGLLSQTGNYPLHEAVCATVAGVLAVCQSCSACTILAIACFRWYIVTRSVRGHQGIHTPKKIAIVVVIIWIASVGWIIPPLLGFGTLGYFEYCGLCTIVLPVAHPFDIFYAALAGVFTATVLMLTLMFYILILRHVLRHNKQILSNSTISDGIRSGPTLNHGRQASSKSREPRPSKIKAINKMEVEITKNLFIVVSALMICFLPFSVNLMIFDTKNVFAFYTFMIILVNSTVNPLIYGFKHPYFKEVFRSLLCCRHVPLE